MKREKFKPADSGENPKEKESDKKTINVIKKLLKILKII
jgi:hypothetical protein